MKKRLSSLLSLILISTSLTTLSYAHEPEGEQDYFTLHMHEILFELGCIDEVTGINDDISKEGIKAFQKKAEIRVDGLIGEETFEQLVLKKYVVMTMRYLILIPEISQRLHLQQLQPLQYLLHL